MPQAGRSRVQDPVRLISFLNLPNLSSLEFTQLQTEISTRSRKIIFMGYAS
jgi:hypothetical protein